MDNKAIAEKLKKLRLAKGETQAETALACDITPSAYGMYETGERIPRDEVKIRIAAHFNRSVAFIFFDKATTKSGNTETRSETEATS